MGRYQAPPNLLPSVAPASPLTGQLWYDPTRLSPEYWDGLVAQVLEPIIEQATRITIIGHSLQAEGGAKLLPYGSSHKFSQFSPAQMDNLARGAATLVSPGIAPATGLGVGSQQAGWEWIIYKQPNTERSVAFDTSGVCTKGINTTIGAGGTTAGLAAGTSVLVGSSAGVAAALADTAHVAFPVWIGGTNPELTYISAAPDATHVQFYKALGGAHAAGDPIVACPDAWLTPRQLMTVEYDWNDLSMMGVTTWQTAFPHAYRALLAWLRCCAFFGVDALNHTDTSGTWTRATTITAASGTRYARTTTNTAVETIKTPILKTGQSVALFFLTDVPGDGAQISISVNGGGAISFDTRDINGFSYVNGTGTRAANGQAMWSTKILRSTDGITTGVNTITITVNTVKTAFYYLGFGIIPADPPPILLGLPFRLLAYAGLYAAPNYVPVDADQATMVTTINSLIAEFTGAGDSLVIPLTTMDTILNKNADYWSADSGHLNDWGQALRAIEFLKLMRSTYVPVKNMMLPTPRMGRNWYPVEAAGSGASVKFNTGWQNEGGTNTPCGYYLELIIGFIALQGDIYCSTLTQGANSVIFTLPPGHRPATQKPVIFMGQGGPLAGTIYANGDVAVAGLEGVGAVDGFVSLSCAAPFMAEQ